MMRVVKTDSGSGACVGVYGPKTAFTGKFYPSELSYRYLIDAQREKPYGGGGDWSQSDINNLEIGVERVNP